MTKYLSFSDFFDKFLTENRFSPCVAGTIVPGHNGLYNEKETIWRNLGHWSRIFTEAQRSLDELSGHYAAFRADFNGYPLKFRDSPKNEANGLIGPAWTLELITHAIQHGNSIISDDLDYIGKCIVEALPFDEKLGFWPSTVEPNGRIGHLDRTFNHQLWWATSIYEFSLACKYEFGAKISQKFFDSSRELMHLDHDGIIYHTIKTRPHYLRTRLKRLIKPRYRMEMRRKEYGYQYFNMIAFSRTMSLIPEPLIQELIESNDMCSNIEFWNSQEHNEYGSSYNPVGIEYAVFNSKLDKIDCVVYGLNKHFSKHFDSKKFEFIGTNDPATLNARAYEASFIDPKLKERLYYDTATNKWLY